MNSWKWILGTEAVGIASGLLSRTGTLRYSWTAVKPAISPPDILFPVVWTILYTLMGLGAARVWAGEDSPARKWGLNLFFTQLTVNFFWSLIFFNAQAYGFAFVWLALLWALAAAMTAAFYRVDRKAALLQIPYLAWLTFAAVLNYQVWILNR